MMRDSEKTIGNLLDKQSIFYLASVSADGFPATRAMLAPRKREGLRVLYFSTNTSSRHVAEFLVSPKASVYVCDKRFFRGATLYGNIEVLTDDEHKKMIWRMGDTMYYPGGVTDPDYCVLRFTALRGRYYANFKSEDFEIPEI